MAMEISFPGGLAVDASYNGFTVRTDQPVEFGGGGQAPAPFDYFLVSLGTCAGLYALRFCQKRGIDTTGLTARLDTEVDPTTYRYTKVRIELGLPEGFPEKYREAVLRAANLCAVKRHIETPPEFEVVAVDAQDRAA